MELSYERQGHLFARLDGGLYSRMTAYVASSPQRVHGVSGYSHHRRPAVQFILCRLPVFNFGMSVHFFSIASTRNVPLTQNITPHVRESRSQSYGTSIKSICFTYIITCPVHSVWYSYYVPLTVLLILKSSVIGRQVGRRES